MTLRDAILLQKRELELRMQEKYVPRDVTLTEGGKKTCTPSYTYFLKGYNLTKNYFL